MKPSASRATISSLALALCLSGMDLLCPANGEARCAQQGHETRRKVRVHDPLADLLAQAYAAIEKKDFAGAVQLLNQYVASRPDDAQAHFQLGYAYTALQRWADAEAQYRKVVALDPKMAPAYQNLGLILLRAEPAAAVEPLRKAADLEPDQAGPRFLLGEALARSGKLAEAVEPYQAAARLDPKNFHFHYELARALLDSNRAGEAELEFRRAVELRPDESPARAGLAESLLAQNKKEEGARELGGYLKAQPQDQEARLRLASVLIGLDRYDQALGELDKLDAKIADSLPAYRLRGEVYLGEQKYPEAAAVLTKAAALAPADAALRARLGKALLLKRDFPAAERELTAALQANPSIPGAARDLMASYYLEGNYAAALDQLDRLARLETPPATDWFVRATCYDRLGRKPEALEAYEKFLELDQGRSDREEFQSRQRVRILERELGKKK